ncbi:hypothetical protein ACWDTP_04570 [Mycobacterium sp. NPDC003449]
MDEPMYHERGVFPTPDGGNLAVGISAGGDALYLLKRRPSGRRTRVVIPGHLAYEIANVLVDAAESLT